MPEKIKKKLIYGLVVVFVAVTAFGTSFFYKSISEEQILDTTTKTLYTIGKDQENRILEFYDNVLYNLNLIAQGYSISGMKCDDVNRIIEYINFKNRDIFMDIFVIDKEFNLIYGNNYGQENFHNNECIKHALGGDLIFGEILKIKNSIYTDVAIPVYRDEEVIGTIYAKVDLTYLNDIMANSKLIGEDAESFMLDSEGIFVTESRFIPNAVGKQSANIGKIKSSIDYSNKLPYKNYRDEEVYGIYFTIPYNKLTLVLEYNNLNMNEKNKEQIEKIGELAALAEVLVLAISKVVYEKLYKNEE
ncbi:MAG: cache domain-containing protein [Anaeromicrobium sp.]|jgi:hypothetical protein|uniref:cache domain-containing protein n=1 Tax=Anaeromicrobium sp. TaxID=1929132 RepID=UPI0025FDD2B4|nr:cache domain-containing protein [Anaeromicrobium sp.]MCT4595063.1 cache domain-containing protein [Anaeromicrobium sp.]